MFRVDSVTPTILSPAPIAMSISAAPAFETMSRWGRQDRVTCLPSVWVIVIGVQTFCPKGEMAGDDVVVPAVPGIGAVTAGVLWAACTGPVPVVVHPAINMLTISTTARTGMR